MNSITQAPVVKPWVGSPLNAVSFDIEEWFHLLEIPDLAHPSRWDTLPQIAYRYTEFILDLLDAAQVRATFFIVGWVARKNPSLVQTIAQRGHEIGSHSYWHLPVYRLSRSQFAEDLRHSIDILQHLTGKPVLGFRAPGFTLTHRTPWAFEVMLDLGLQYDASLIPHRPQSFNSPAHPHLREESGRSLLELPVSTVRLGSQSIPFCGGGYLRLLPAWLLRLLLRQRQAQGLPSVLYLHPRDFAIDCPRIPLPLTRYFRTYHGLHSTQPKLEQLLREFQWDCCAAVLGLIPARSPVQAPSSARSHPSFLQQAA
ncbi:MAG: polysaccharide deacetylase family protein [Oculatellaceae cyanobacterium Prado106]|jgi:polysaccharide deacetylase family protein (PEP-CTERM system associated)|nr:polysaccharide deacetylase family protein [Oculatellaceae cyanobacterium Prado106]